MYSFISVPLRSLFSVMIFVTVRPIRGDHSKTPIERPSKTYPLFAFVRSEHMPALLRLFVGLPTYPLLFLAHIHTNNIVQT